MSWTATHKSLMEKLAKKKQGLPKEYGMPAQISNRVVGEGLAGYLTGKVVRRAAMVGEETAARDLILGLAESESMKPGHGVRFFGSAAGRELKHLPKLTAVIGAGAGLISGAIHGHRLRRAYDIGRGKKK